MSNKEWYIIFTKGPNGLYRYAIEHYLLPPDGFESQEAYDRWFYEVSAYFVERTGIKEEVLAIEPAEFLSAYSMVKEA